MAIRRGVEVELVNIVEVNVEVELEKRTRFLAFGFEERKKEEVEKSASDIIILRVCAWSVGSLVESVEVFDDGIYRIAGGEGKWRCGMRMVVVEEEKGRLQRQRKRRW